MEDASLEGSEESSDSESNTGTDVTTEGSGNHLPLLATVLTMMHLVTGYLNPGYSLSQLMKTISAAISKKCIFSIGGMHHNNEPSATFFPKKIKIEVIYFKKPRFETIGNLSEY